MPTNRSAIQSIVPAALLAAALVFFQTPDARAHRATIFAWVEGDTVHTVSKFSGGKRVRAGTVIVRDVEGNRLLEGKTDGQGEFDFPVPTRPGPEIELLAGAGHRGQWTIPAEELGAGPSGGGSAAVPKSETAKPPAKEVHGSGPTAVEIAQALDRALDDKLKPLMRMLAEQQDRGPTLRDILGGIGYILGLVGIAAYMHARRCGK